MNSHILMYFIKKIIIIISLILLPNFSYTLYAEEKIVTIDDMAQVLVDGLVNNLKVKENPLNVKIGRLTIENTYYSSKFADIFLHFIERELKKHKDHFNEISRVKYTRDLGLFQSEPEIGNKIRNVILEGSYRDDETRNLVLLSAKLVDQNNSSIVSEYYIEIEKSSFSWDLNPQNLSELKETENKINASPAKIDFKIDLQIDKGNGGIYQEGENISIWFRAEVDCYLKVLYIDAEGNHVLMFPSGRDTKGILKKGFIYSLDTNNTYNVSPPFGTETIIAFASTDPFDNLEDINIGGGYRGFDKNKKTSDIVKSLRGMPVNRGVVDPRIHSGKKVKRSEARVYLTTVGKR